MLSIASLLFAAAPVTVPDSGVTGYLLGFAIVSLGLAARFLKSHKR